MGNPILAPNPMGMGMGKNLPEPINKMPQFQFLFSAIFVF
jgi:hypothetical protein